MVPRQRPIPVPGSTAAETAGTPIDYRLAEKADVSLGTVVGAPRLWLQLEGVTLLAGSLVAFSGTHRSWWLVPLVLFLPDLFMAGYVGGTRIGAHVYNLAHTTTLPALMVGYGWWQNSPLLLALGLVWLGHIGMDRLLTLGLKYPDHFQHTHLSSPHEHRTTPRIGEQT
jgi:hypothetical protein